MTHFIRKALLSLVCVLFMATQAQAGFYKKEYKLSVVPGLGSGWGMSAVYFADLVKEKTQGRINIKVYAGAQLMAGKQTSELLLLRNGSIDFALASTINWSPQVKELNLTALPFFVANNPDRYKAMDAIESGKAGKMMIEAIEKTPDDMKGMKLRVCGTPIFADIFTALGANPQAINWSEAVTGFQQGIVDGQENPTNGINIPLKVWTWHKYLIDWHYMIDPLLLTANQNVWKNFSKEDQEIILECAALAEKYSKALSRLGFDDGSSLAYLQSIGKVPEITDPYKVLEDNGMSVIRFDEQKIKLFYDATESVRIKWTSQIGEDLVSAAQADMNSVK